MRRLRDLGHLSPEYVTSLADSAALDFYKNAAPQESSEFEAAEYLRPAISLLAELSTLQLTELSAPAISALFQKVIEPLNDSFHPRLSELSDRAMAQIIALYLGQPTSKTFALAMRSFGLECEADILRRRASLSRRFRPQALKPIQKVLILSRITIGADVAVTSVLANHLGQVAPHAEIVILGPEKLEEVFGGAGGFRCRSLGYQRTGSLTTRLDSWLVLLDSIASETKGLRDGEFLVVDPDSRLTQLGLLPVSANDFNYALFESRQFQSIGAESLGELAARWAREKWPGSSGAEILGGPRVALPDHWLDLGARVGARLRARGAQRVVFLSFGVGGNENKRVSSDFEQALSLAIAKDAVLIVDRGATDAERVQVDAILLLLRQSGCSILEAGETGPVQWPDGDARVDVFVWNGGIGSFSGLIAASDLYIGYDSAGQHIAAALGIPTMTVFVNNSTRLFANRWSPIGPGEKRSLYLPAKELISTPTADIVEKVLALSRELRHPG